MVLSKRGARLSGVIALSFLASTSATGRGQEAGADSAPPPAPARIAGATAGAPAGAPAPAKALPPRARGAAPAVVPAPPGHPGASAGLSPPSADNAPVAVIGGGASSPAVLMSPDGTVVAIARDSDDRIVELELRLRKLSAEVARLRAERGKGPAQFNFALGDSPGQPGFEIPAPRPGSGAPPPQGWAGGVVWGGSGDQVWEESEGRTAAITKSKHKLPHAKAEALASFLRENADADLDVAVKGDSLIITCDEATRSAVTRIISVMSRTSPRTGIEDANATVAPASGLGVSVTAPRAK